MKLRLWSSSEEGSLENKMIKIVTIISLELLQAVGRFFEQQRALGSRVDSSVQHR
jgi:hypothetical protein